MDNIGKRLKNLRNSKGMTLQDVASRADTARTYIADIESGRSFPSLKMLDKICKALNAPASYVFGDKLHRVELPQDLEEFLSKPDAIQYIYLAKSFFEGRVDPITLNKFIDNQNFVKAILKNKLSKVQQEVIISMIEQFSS